MDEGRPAPGSTLRDGLAATAGLVVGLAAGAVVAFAVGFAVGLGVGFFVGFGVEAPVTTTLPVNPWSVQV